MFKRLFSRAGLSLERLRTFVEVADAGSMAQAANGDAVRQSLFSRQIKELEEHFGRKLTERSGRNVVLNTAGVELAALARQILAVLEDFHSEGQGKAEPVIFAAGESFLRGVVLPKLTTIRERLPGAVLELRNLRGREVAGALIEGRIDLGVLDEGEETGSEIQAQPLGRVHYRLVVAQRGADAVDWKAAFARPFVVMEGSTRLNDAAARLARNVGEELHVAVRCSSWQSVADAVSFIGGAAFVPNIVPLPALCSVVELPRVKLPERILRLAWSARRGGLRKNSELWRRVLGEVLKF